MNTPQQGKANELSGTAMCTPGASGVYRPHREVRHTAVLGNTQHSFLGGGILRHVN